MATNNNQINLQQLQSVPTAAFAAKFQSKKGKLSNLN